ncbi:MAG: sigma-70 family RNA polymerase sigma factor [Deltaproteobacteria bacterium]|nr:sigma-70 family RNA polymerase sigma factor [Deltaproteobacteria bacterium]
MPDPAARDEFLMQAAGKGDLEAFGEIVQRHHSWAWRIAYRFLGDEPEAADIVQEAFLRLLDASRRYRPTAKFRTYFYRIITRLCLDRTKKKQPLYLETIPDAPDPRPDAADAMVLQEAAVAVRAALDVLPPNQRMAIVLRYYEELNYEDIASALETTPKAVERLLAHGRERLRAILGGRDEFFCS